MAYHWTPHIDAPPEKVFDTLADIEHHPEWANPKAKLNMSSVSGGPPALGSRFRSEQVFVGKPQTADIEIVGSTARAVSRSPSASASRVGAARTCTSRTPSPFHPRTAAPSSSARPTATVTSSSASSRSRGINEGRAHVARQPQGEGRSLELRVRPGRWARGARYSAHARGRALGRRRPSDRGAGARPAPAR